MLSLCEDDVWGVRKACAEVFMPLSCVCSPAVRQFELSPLFVNLLRDQSRCVQSANAVCTFLTADLWCA